MPLVRVSITAKQKRSLDRKIKRAGRGSLPSEIRKAINQYLAGPRQVEAAFLKLLMQKAPKNLGALLAQAKKAEKRIDRNLAWLRQRVGVGKRPHRTHKKELTPKITKQNRHKSTDWVPVGKEQL